MGTSGLASIPAEMKAEGQENGRQTRLEVSLLKSKPERGADTGGRVKEKTASSKRNNLEEFSLCTAATLQIHWGVTDTWWNSSHDCSHEMDGYRLHKKDRQGR